MKTAEEIASEMYPFPETPVLKMVAKRKALDAPHSPYALLGNVGLRGMISARCAI